MGPKRLPSLDVIPTWGNGSSADPKCRRYKLANEDDQHFLKCTNSRAALQLTRLQNYHQMELKLKHTSIYSGLGPVEDELQVTLATAMGMADTHFLDTPEARGVMTSRTLERLDNTIPNQIPSTGKNSLLH